ncbi:hypothetical protein ACXO4M_09245 [Lactobacillus delbrueckii subsp. bulgaricus]
MSFQGFIVLFGVGSLSNSTMSSKLRVRYANKQNLDRYDLIFVPGQSDVVARLRTKTPIIRYSDATVALMIVVPRQLKFNEHVNNHQVDFTKLIAERMNNIIPVYDIANLGQTIADYDTIVKKNSGESSNNLKFNADLDTLLMR